MGSTHHTGTTATRRAAAIAAAAAVLALTACAAGEDADDAASAAATAPAAEAPAAVERADDAEYGVVGEEESGGAAQGRADLATLQPAGQQLAISARASMRTDDVRAAVERITTTVSTRGGRVASAEIDYASDGDDDTGTSRATLVLAVPPGELGAVRGVLDDVGEVVSYDQLAEDVTEQLADLDTRIANQRASIERIRELYATAVDVDAIVRIEAELTDRETVLEQLLATQQGVADRVATSTLTVDITTAPAEADPVDEEGTGIGDALAAGWSAFAGGVFAVVLALAAALPFLLALLAVAVLALTVRRAVRRRPATATRHEVMAPEEPVSASRQG